MCIRDSQKTASGFVAILMGSPADAGHAERCAKTLADLGIPSRRHVASAHKTPLFVLQLVQQLDNMLGRLVYITLAGRSNALSAMLDAQTANPVIACPVIGSTWGGMEVLSSLYVPSGVANAVVLEPENAALAAAKILAVDDTVLYGRVLVSQHRRRAAVIEADARLNAQAGQGNGKRA